jgi:hypothetical protein
MNHVAGNPISCADLYLDTQPNGSAEQFIDSNPDQLNRISGSSSSVS